MSLATAACAGCGGLSHSEKDMAEQALDGTRDGEKHK
jgi:hypothetical protein